MTKTLLSFLTVTLFWVSTSFAQQSWPRSIPTGDGGKLTIYEPQPESMSGDKLTARAAASIRKSESAEPVFGVVFFNATLDGNNEISAMRITQAKFTGIDDQNQVDDYSSLIEKNSSGWSLGMSDKQIEEAIDREKGASEDFKNAAPKIIYTNKPSTLIVLDGEPKVTHDKNLDADKVVNSPNLIFKEGNQWNLYAGGNWYRSNSLDGNWKVNKNLSRKLEKVNEEIKKQEKENNKDQQVSQPRETDIIIATEPTELLQTDGEPEYKTVAGTSLLYVSNSPNEIFKDINSQKSYILIAGRWYSSSNMNGSWTYVPSDQLPEDFAKIPEGSDKDRVLANVAGTDAAEDAIVNAAVPQTAKIDKRTASIEVQYDGEPVFNPISGTSLDLAENSNVTVMRDASGRYFALDNGIWFVGQSAYGPWKVANERPSDVDDIPASSPAYNTRYVYIYDDSPEYVYMGYTSGYLGSYYYGPTLVYGTGWHYRPWYRSVYYPRPITWGFGFMYDPWIGWNINWGFNYGFLYVGFNYGGYYGPYAYGYGGGWFGPRYYCPPYRRHYYGGYYGRNYDYYGYNSYGYRRNDYGYNSRVNGNGSRPDRRSGVRQTPGQGSGWTRNYNLYNNQRGVTTQNVSRSPRVYRPETLTRVDGNGVNGRYSNRLTNPNNNGRQFESSFDNNRVESTTPNNGSRLPRTNPRDPAVTTPDRRNENVTRPQSTPSTESRRLERPQQGERPQRVYSPSTEPQQQRSLPEPERRQPRTFSPPAERQEPRTVSPPAERQQRTYSPPAERQQRSYSPPAERQETQLFTAGKTGTQLLTTCTTATELFGAAC